MRNRHDQSHRAGLQRDRAPSAGDQAVAHNRVLGVGMVGGSGDDADRRHHPRGGDDHGAAIQSCSRRHGGHVGLHGALACAAGGARTKTKGCGPDQEMS